MTYERPRGDVFDQLPNTPVSRFDRGVCLINALITGAVVGVLAGFVGGLVADLSMGLAASMGAAVTEALGDGAGAPRHFPGWLDWAIAISVGCYAAGVAAFGSYGRLCDRVQMANFKFLHRDELARHELAAAIAYARRIGG